MEDKEPFVRDEELARQAASFAPPSNPLLLNLLTFVVLGVPLLLAMTGMLGGGKPSVLWVRTEAARLEVEAPEYVRNGMIGEIHIRLSPTRAVAAPAILMPDGWLRGFTINQSSPSPLEERSVEGGSRLTFPPLAAGATLDLSLSFQVHPDRHGRGEGVVSAVDGDRPLASIPVRIRVWP